jgi:hypothetical protein
MPRRFMIGARSPPLGKAPADVDALLGLAKPLQVVSQLSARGLRSALNAFRCGWPRRGCEWTFSPFRCGVVTTYTLEVGAAGDGDNGDRLFTAFRAARWSIHGILPILPQTRKPERLFHQLCCIEFRRSARKLPFILPKRQIKFATGVTEDAIDRGAMPARA